MKRGIALDRFDDDLDQGPTARRERLAVNDNLVSDTQYRRVMDMPVEDSTAPGRMSKDAIAELGAVDGFIDSCLNRPPSIAHRFVESRLHIENMKAFATYSDSYQAAWRRKEVSK